MSHDRSMTLHFNDGTRLAFEFPEQAANVAARQLKLAEFMTNRHVVVEADGSVLIFPIANIKYIALNAPGQGLAKAMALPKHAITGARIRD